MSDTTHVPYGQPTGPEMLSGSANWAFDNGNCTYCNPGIRPAPLAWLPWAVGAALLTVSTMSTALDPWSEAQKQRDKIAASSTFQTSSRRRITLLEARRMALDILHRAETGRARAAEAEAKLDFDWEETA